MEEIQAGLRSFFRVLIFAVSLSLFFASAFVIHLFTRDLKTRKRRFSNHGVYWNRYACWMFGIQVIVKGNRDPKQGGLVVGNHLGFIDILASASVRANLFVTSKEMHQVPVLGLITEMGGCIYVERRDRSNIMNEMGEIIEALKDGARVILYPEATSTNGEGILPFKRTLMQAAAMAGVPVIPYVFNFRELNKEPGFKIKYRDSVCWYGDISFPVSLWRAFGLKSLVCEIEFLEPVYQAQDEDRGAFADRVRELILAKFDPVS